MDEALQMLLADVFEVRPEKITERDTFQTIPGWDSLKHLQLVMALEQKFGIAIDAEQISGIQSVADIVRLLDRTR